MANGAITNISLSQVLRLVAVKRLRALVPRLLALLFVAVLACEPGTTIGEAPCHEDVGSPDGGWPAPTAGAEPKLVTSAPDAYWQAGTWSETSSGTPDLTVHDSTICQTWSGFGGAFNEAGWDVLSLLEPSERDRAMQLLFDPKDGAGFVLGRVPVGASDYAIARYTLDDTAGDFTMVSFSIERDKLLLLPYIKAALAKNPDLHLWASPWSPPAWMKSSNAIDRGSMKDDPTILQAYALYLAYFVEAYAREGVTIEAMHPQNEPSYDPHYPSCLWTPALFRDFIAGYLGPTFADRNLTAQIYVGTMSNADSGKDGTILNTVTDDPTAMAYVKGLGLQWNMLSQAASLVAKQLPIVQTEHKCGNYPWQGSTFRRDQAPNDHAYAVESWRLIRDWIKAGVNAYSAWNMVLDTLGFNLDTARPWPQNALLTVDRAARALIVTPTYYVFRHVSQFVVPGARRLAITGNGDALAFKNPDGSIVTIVYNPGNSAAPTRLAVGTAQLQFDVPANGWATVNWP
jgi:glucosylceramidase